MRKYLTISIVAVFIVTAFFLIVGCQNKDISSTDNANIQSKMPSANPLPSSNVKEGWKFLTWGMSIDETNTLLVKNGMKKMDFHYNFSSDQPGIVYGPDQFVSEIIKCGKSDRIGEFNNWFEFYFVNEKLTAVKLYYQFEDNNAVVDQLKNNFPDGKIEKESSSNTFSYIGNNIIVFNRDFRYRLAEIWYVNPEVKKIKSDMERLEKQYEEIIRK
jgi:hypothetical protein